MRIAGSQTRFNYTNTTMKIKKVTLPGFEEQRFANAEMILKRLGCTGAGHQGRFLAEAFAFPKEGAGFTAELHGENKFVLVKDLDGHVRAKGFAYDVDLKQCNFKAQLYLDGSLERAVILHCEE
jgi:hypothetical protein